jgi:hypothetical protein
MDGVTVGPRLTPLSIFATFVIESCDVVTGRMTDPVFEQLVRGPDRFQVRHAPPSAAMESGNAKFLQGIVPRLLGRIGVPRFVENK